MGNSNIRTIVHHADGTYTVTEQEVTGRYDASTITRDNPYGSQTPVGPPKMAKPTKEELAVIQKRREELAKANKVYEQKHQEYLQAQAAMQAEKSEEQDEFLAILRIETEERRRRVEQRQLELAQQMSAFGNTQNNPLPVVEVAPPPNSINVICGICASDFDKRSSEAAYLECTHWYHYDCINEWTRKGHHTCPECRHNCAHLNKVKMPDN